MQSMARLIALLSAIAILAAYAYAQVPTELKYRVNDVMVYWVEGSVDARGQLLDSDQRTSGSTSTMNGTLVAQCIGANETTYLFVMNMFGVTVGVGEDGAPFEYASFESPGVQAEQPIWYYNYYGPALGYDVYYEQNKTGEITQIWINTGDPVYYVQVKLGAINAFHTHLVGVASSQRVLQRDPVGVHYGLFEGALGASQEGLVVNQTFSQSDVQQFADPTLLPSNVLLAAGSTVTVAPQGYVAAATVGQQVVFVDFAAAANRMRASDTAYPSNATGFDMNLSSWGLLTVTMDTQASFAAPAWSPESTAAELNANPALVSTTLLDAARAVFTERRAVRRQATPAHGNLHRYLTALVDTANSADHIAELSESIVRAVRADREGSAEFIRPLIDKYNTDARILARLFAVCARAGLEEVIITSGLLGSTRSTVLQGVLAAAAVANPSSKLLTALSAVAFGNDPYAPVADEARRAAILAVGAVLGRVEDDVIRRQGQVHLAAAYAHATGHDRTVIGLALRNAAGEAAVPLESSFPFNKTYSGEVTLGGSTVSIDVEGEFFVGTNFDCQQSYFNYEALAQASASVSLLGISQQAVLAQAIYGWQDGQNLANELQLQVWGKVVYSQPIPSADLDCQAHSYPIASASPGFDVEHTLWISIIPVDFTAQATLDLDLTWGWEICPASLSASVDIQPAAALTVMGNTEIDLLILKAGLTLQGTFSSQLTPTAFVDGTNCDVGVELVWTTSPMSASFFSYYQWEHCILWFFDCKWGTYNQKVWWSWSANPVNEVLYEQQWNIA